MSAPTPAPTPALDGPVPAGLPLARPAPARPVAAGAVLKACGATTDDDLVQVAAGGAGLVGLWHGIPGGRGDLPLGHLAALARTARALGVEPVLVTFLDDHAALAGVLEATGIAWVQMHAYQRPGTVRRLRALCPDAVVVKVLHLEGGRCVERRFAGAYERAGAAAFLLDVATARGRVGSTGQALPPVAAAELVAATTLPFLLAGGVTAAGRARYGPLAAHPRFLGVDVDTAARDRLGRLDARRIDAVRRGWRIGGSPARAAATTPSRAPSRAPSRVAGGAGRGYTTGRLAAASQEPAT